MGLGIDGPNCTTSTVVTAEGLNAGSLSCADQAGNVAEANYSVRLDKTPPVGDPTKLS